MLHHCRMLRYSTRMPTLKYAIEFRGTTVKRASAAGRIYAFVTVSTGHTVEREARILEIDAEHQERMAALEGHERMSPTYINGKTVEESYQIWYTRSLVEAKRLRETDPADRAKRVYDWGWSSRRDLAEKNAARARSLGYQNVTVLEVPQP